MVMTVIETDDGWRFDGKYWLAYFNVKRSVLYTVILGKHTRFEGTKDAARIFIRTELKRLGFILIE